MEVLAFTNWKGGVAKTTSVANLGPALAERGRRVLLVDLDPQANLTEAFGFLDEPAIGVHDLLDGAGGHDPAEALLAVGPGVELLPGSERLGDLAWRLVGEHDYQDRLRQVLEPLDERYDLALIDTPPGIGLWPGLALLAADAVLIPTRPHDSDVLATGKIADYIESDIRPANPGLRLLGALVTQSQSRWRLLRDTRRRFALDDVEVLENEVPASVRAASALRSGRPTFWLEPDGKVAMAYRRVAEELLAKLERVHA